MYVDSVVQAVECVYTECSMKCMLHAADKKITAKC